ncbi:hypothetical protein NEMBOFW57_002539 [Staphylotrichum longicolle]|uniref:t-SNARE coiled-coil homology domain-containing protein n=1 Tax=Staphylotrichum longicolle TaxID=669026 RepID=A0AAD4HYS5_9PEZI|nr:hypothetical protein NEMBOFW57_002539 [Staphylotrichum longicolle]
MGRMGGWFKKSDDKEKSASNPYAQQPSVTQQQPVGQTSPPPLYDQYSQYNGNQYNANQNLPQSRQGPPSGLPAGPRAGLPSTFGQGPPRTGTWESNNTAPPEYDEQPGHGAPPPSYHRPSPTSSTGWSPALSSSRASPSIGPNGGSPALSSTTSPSLGTGYPREKLGAADGVGKSRFDQPVASRYNNSPSLPSQRQGGYGGLDTGREELFANYKGPSQSTTGPNLAQSTSPYSGDGGFNEEREMTEEERKDAEVAGLKAQIEAEQIGTEDSLDRSLQAVTAANSMFDNLLNDFEIQESRMDNAERNLAKTHNLNDQAKDQTARLKYYNRRLFQPGYNRSKQDQLAAEFAEKDLRHQRELEELRAEQDQRRQGIQNQYDDNGRRVLAPKKLGQEDINRFTFEDEDGQQQARLERTDEKMELLGAAVGTLNLKSKLLRDRADDSNARLVRMGESP